MHKPPVATPFCAGSARRPVCVCARRRIGYHVRVMGVVLRAVSAGDLRKVDFDLPRREEFEQTLHSAVREHPLAGEEFRRAAGGILFEVAVVVADGSMRDYSSMATNAEIFYDPFLADPSQPVELVFHLRCYLGEDPLDWSRTIPCKDAPRLARETVFDPEGLRKTLLHEFSHLADALDAEFGYSPGKKLSLSRIQRAVLMDLWNGYIDRRLRDALPWPEELRPAMRRTSRKRTVNEALLRVWGGESFAYDELISLARNVKLT